MLRFAAQRRPGAAQYFARFLSTAKPYSSVVEAAFSDKPPFEKILIANRGEIACRVMRTAKKMGIKTVAVYSTADANSLHVAMADEAVCVGPPATSQSYLNIDNIVSAIKATGAQAVHPGYGFLSENSHFADRLDEIGVTFIGPSFKSIAAMGDKIESKKLAVGLKVNTIPGFNGVVENVEHAREIAHQIGYPVMVKASAGGGGKGMRIAWDDEEIKESYRLSKAEAKSSFGDDRLLVEKFVDNPRHIEVQILGDKFGNTLYLNERECSIQRRNQKVIEEAPSPHLDAKTRAAMGEQAVRLAQAVEYYSAGTVEFLVDPQRNFYFLEMNTRLQVEHPITEKITGIDIVEHMIKIAANQRLKLKQSDIGIKGWAFESRVYAEDPTKYLPSIGRLGTYIEPKSDDGSIRVDSGIIEGSEISMYYDPMISKLITYGKNRSEALSVMLNALDSYVVKGVTHNIPLLRDIYSHKRFQEGKLSTKYLPEEYPDGFHGKTLNPTELNELLVTAAVVNLVKAERKQEWVSDKILRRDTDTSGLHNKDYVISVKGLGDYPIHLKDTGKTFQVTHNGTTTEIDAASFQWPVDSHLINASIDGKKKILQYLDHLPLGFRLVHYGTRYDIQFYSPEAFKLLQNFPEKPKTDFSKMIVSPMPGAVVSVAVKEGDRVIENQEVAVVEAMKMQNVLRSQRHGVVKKVLVKVGDSVQADEVMIEFGDA